MIDLPETSLRVTYVDEPELEFGHGQRLDHPKMGSFYTALKVSPASVKCA